jgi:endonuclease G, mitochondrial
MNQITWAAFESYCRTLITHGNELYIISGRYGSGGSGSLGGTTYNIHSGAINVPSHFWKVVVVLPVGTNDVSRVSATTRIIAIDMANTESVTAHSWDYYRTTTDAIEAATGYNVLSNIPVGIQTVIESTVDTGPAF